MPIIIPGLSQIPFVGKLLFSQDAIFYFSIVLLVGINWFLFNTRAGLVLRSVGDNHTSAHSLGLDVIKIRYLAVMFGGACSGLAECASGTGLCAAMGGRHVGGQGVDCLLALVVFCIMATVANFGGSLSVWRGNHYAIAYSGARHKSLVISAILDLWPARIDEIHTVTISLGTAIYRDNHCISHYIAEPPIDSD